MPPEYAKKIRKEIGLLKTPQMLLQDLIYKKTIFFYFFYLFGGVGLFFCEPRRVSKRERHLRWGRLALLLLSSSKAGAVSEWDGLGSITINYSMNI
jgi:hypothetical protein